MRIIPRSEFGWGPTSAATANPRNGLVIHYDGSNQGLARKSHSACVEYWKRTRKFHMGPARGWADIGYSFGACPHGYIFEGRGLNRMQAAQPGGNSTWYSVTLMSGPDEDPTPEQINAVRQLRVWLMSKGVGAAVKGHRDFFSTSCPGDRLYRMVRDGVFSKAPSEEDELPSVKDVWTYEIPVPFGSKDNPEWQAKSLLVNHGVWLRKIAAKVDAQNATIKALAEALAQRDSQLDIDALVARIRAEVDAALAAHDADAVSAGDGNWPPKDRA